MMKPCLVAGLLLAIAPLATADEPYPSGFSSGPVNLSDALDESEVRPLLREQTDRPQPEEGELPAGLFVDTQVRAAESFQRPVPDTLLNETRGE